jgi:hypothetical protein
MRGADRVRQNRQCEEPAPAGFGGMIFVHWSDTPDRRTHEITPYRNMRHCAMVSGAAGPV